MDYETRGVLYHELTHGFQLLRKLNQSTLKVVPWSFEGGIQYALGKDRHVEDLWKEYQKAMGDI